MVSGLFGGRARGRRHHGHGDQHSRRRPDRGIGGAARLAPAGAVAGPRPLRRADPPCSSRRHPDESGLGHHRLAPPHPGSPHPAGASPGHGGDPGAHGFRRPGDRRGDRADRRGHGQRAAAGTPRARQRGLGAADGPDVLLRTRGCGGDGSVFGPGRSGCPQGELHRRVPPTSWWQ